MGKNGAYSGDAKIIAISKIYNLSVRIYYIVRTKPLSHKMS
jgi:hypothetical protein